ncbi:hypothetical protein RRG08_005692 [Elysia crispata]|uniref:Uncharacterized protein n=1 Tax=Elysia crispata TaxID=231223 RepID=A0AAE1CX33_9GAST|nr:hypothetical protein RRG08_005692 [Elysia crispata]
MRHAPQVTTLKTGRSPCSIDLAAGSGRPGATGFEPDWLQRSTTARCVNNAVATPVERFKSAPGGHNTAFCRALVHKQPCLLAVVDQVWPS